MTDHICPHPTCTKSVTRDKFSCAHHWFELPLPIRNEIWTTFLQDHGSPEHVEAMDKALAFWKGPGPLAMNEPGEVPDAIVFWARRTLPGNVITRCDCDKAGARWAGQHLCATGGGLALCFYIDELSDVCVILGVTITK